MTIGIAIILGGWAYACSCRLSGRVSETGIARGRRMGLFCTCLGIFIDVILVAA